MLSEMEGGIYRVVEEKIWGILHFFCGFGSPTASPTVTIQRLPTTAPPIAPPRQRAARLPPRSRPTPARLSPPPQAVAGRYRPVSPGDAATAPGYRPAPLPPAYRPAAGSSARPPARTSTSLIR